MSDAPKGADESRQTLIEHLSELRIRLLKSLIAIVVTTSGALFFAPQLLEYTVQPLTHVLKDRNRVETVLIHADKDKGARLEEQLVAHPLVRFRGRFPNSSLVRELVEKQIEERHPIDLVLVAVGTLGDSGALVSDLLEGIDPPPDVAYLVGDIHDPAVAELQLEGASLIPDPPRAAALSRIVRRAAATAGKASASGEKLVVLSPLDPFFAYLKIALVVGLFLACPVWLYQAWRFVAPGLYANEKMIVAPTILSASVLFISGGLFAYFVMFPTMFEVLINDMMPSSLVGTFTVDKYLSLLIAMTVAFGIVFELPLIIALLSAMGIVTPAILRKMRKYAVVGSFVFAAIITPTTDPLSFMMMAVPLCLFYEIGIVLAVILHRRRVQKLRALAATSSSGA